MGLSLNFMDEELVKDIHKLAMDNPCIDLMEENLVADEKDLWEHVLDNWVPAYASLVQSVKKISSS